MQETLARLLANTDGCREDMHEPDEQDLSAEVYGERLDNAWGDNPNSGELIVALSTSEGDEEWFNLATLIALARKADLNEDESARTHFFGKKNITPTTGPRSKQ